MKSNSIINSRRQFLKNLSFGTIAFATAGSFADNIIHTASEAFAKEFMSTPGQTEGPFYPDRLPLDTDNDLVLISNTMTPAAGEITHLTGRVLGQTGEPVEDVIVEIWHVDSKGIYLHTRCPNRDQRDRNFQGYGRTITSSSGEYYFRTIKPVPYNLGVKRTPHIHFIIRKGDKRFLTTQMYIKGHPLNKEDFIFQRIQGKEEREAVLVDFKPVNLSKKGELKANFEIVLGITPEEPLKDLFRHHDGHPVENL